MDKREIMTSILCSGDLWRVTPEEFTQSISVASKEADEIIEATPECDTEEVKQARQREKTLDKIATLNKSLPGLEGGKKQATLAKIDNLARHL